MARAVYTGALYAAIDGWKSEHVVKYFEIQDCFCGERLILSGIQGMGKAPEDCPGIYEIFGPSSGKTWGQD